MKIATINVNGIREAVGRGFLDWLAGQDAWTAAPHPALAQAWRDLRPDEAPERRAARLDKLAALHPDHRESRIQRTEAALLRGEADAAADQLKPLVSRGAPSARLCGLMAQIEAGRDNAEAAREWVDRAAHAAGEPDWSDLDPDGPAFNYEDEDWARLVFTFGDAGKLIHPRHERYEREIALAPPLAALPAPDAPAKPVMEAGAEAAPAPIPVPRPRRAPKRAGQPREAGEPPRPDDPGPAGEDYEEGEEGGRARLARKYE